MIKADFHTHSIASPDGGLSEADYLFFLERRLLDFVAITDHNDLEFAQLMAKRLGKRIIVGEEITSSEGELIGLFLKERIAPGATAMETAAAIHAQGGLVYLPHPFETVRQGISELVATELCESIDIVEVKNGRAVQNRSQYALDWAAAQNRPGAASSDAHGRAGLGRTYSQLAKAPTAANLVAQLASAQLVYHRPPLLAFAQPKLNRTKRRLRRLKR